MHACLSKWVSLHSEHLCGLRPAIQCWCLQVATLTNGSVAITEGLLQRSGLDDHVCLKLDVAGPQKWKPAHEAYHYAVERLQLQDTPEQAGALPDGLCQHAAAALPAGAATPCTLPANVHACWRAAGRQSARHGPSYGRALQALRPTTCALTTLW